MKDNRAYLLHMRDAIERVTRYTAEGQAAFLADTKTQDAVVRNLEIIGEAAKQLSEDLKTEHPGVPWRQSARRRRFFRHFCVAACIGDGAREADGQAASPRGLLWRACGGAPMLR